jgi:putative flippase GtrA
MRILSRRDIAFSLITGLTTGIIAWRILVFLGRVLPLGADPVILVTLVPVLWLVGVQFGYALAGLFRPMAQFGRFAAIGFANAAVDFGVLYLFIGLTGLVSVTAYAAFKAVSFLVATTHSYFWNKRWAFDASRSRGGSGELARFIGVALASVVVNVAVASLIVAARPVSFDAAAWAGISAIAGSAIALIFSFAGFRIFVFKKK